MKRRKKWKRKEWSMEGKIKNGNEEKEGRMYRRKEGRGKMNWKEEEDGESYRVLDCQNSNIFSKCDHSALRRTTLTLSVFFQDARQNSAIQIILPHRLLLPRFATCVAPLRRFAVWWLLRGHGSSLANSRPLRGLVIRRSVYL